MPVAKRKGIVIGLQIQTDLAGSSIDSEGRIAAGTSLADTTS